MRYLIDYKKIIYGGKEEGNKSVIGEVAEKKCVSIRFILKVMLEAEKLKKYGRTFQTIECLKVGIKKSCIKITIILVYPSYCLFKILQIRPKIRNKGYKTISIKRRIPQSTSILNI